MPASTRRVGRSGTVFGTLALSTRVSRTSVRTHAGSQSKICTHTLTQLRSETSATAQACSAADQDQGEAKIKMPDSPVAIGLVPVNVTLPIA